MNFARDKIQRTRLSDQVIDRLIGLIVAGTLKPGDKLPPEPRLMEQFGVGRSSIREAIGALELIGLLNVRPGDGTRLTSAADMVNSRVVGLSLITLGHDAIADLVEARTDLEVSMVRHAVQRATEEDFAEIRRQQKKMARASSTRMFITADLGFHEAIARASHNSVLIRLFSELHRPIHHWMEQKHKFDWGGDQVAEDHEAILQALENRDTDAAQRAVQLHVERAGEKLLTAMQDHPKKA